MDTEPSPRPAGAQTTPGPLPQYDENGVDLSLIRANLRLTVEERARRAERQRQAALRVQQIGRGLRPSPLERFCALLAEAGVEFMVIGGQAEALMGGARVTYDVDLCYRRTPENIERLARALNRLRLTLRGAPPDLKFRIEAGRPSRWAPVSRSRSKLASTPWTCWPTSIR